MNEPREVKMLSLRQNNNPSFPGACPGKDTPRAANAATKEGVNGGENARTSFCEVRALSSPSKSRERGDERGGQRGRKRTNELLAK